MRTQGEGKKRHARTRAAQKERGSLPWFCSNPDRDDRVTSTASNCNTASPVRASSRHRSRMHTPRERLRVPPEKLACLNAYLANLNGPRVRVKCERKTSIYRVRMSGAISAFSCSGRNMLRPARLGEPRVTSHESPLLPSPRAIILPAATQLPPIRACRRSI